MGNNLVLPASQCCQDGSGLGGEERLREIRAGSNLNISQFLLLPGLVPQDFY